MQVPTQSVGTRKKLRDQAQLGVLRGQEQLAVPVELSAVETGMVLPPDHPQP